MIMRIWAGVARYTPRQDKTRQINCNEGMKNHSTSLYHGLSAHWRSIDKVAQKAPEKKMPLTTVVANPKGVGAPMKSPVRSLAVNTGECVDCLKEKCLFGGHG
jgi:hypothetical protein